MIEKTIPQVFLSTAEKHAEKTLFNYRAEGDSSTRWESMTYGEFLHHVKAIASYLIKSGISKGDRAAIISENRHEWCASYLAVLMAGGIAVPISVESTEEEVETLLRDSEAKAVCFGSKAKRAVGQGVYAVDFDSSEFREMLGMPYVDFNPDIRPEDTASLLYTSGTTGTPKGVMLSHRNLCSDAEAVIKANVISGKDNVLCLLPLHHTYPFMCNFLVPLFLGASITFAPSLKGPEILASIKGTGVTVLVGVPQLLELMRDGILRKIKNLPFAAALLHLLSLSGAIRVKTGINAGKLIFGSVHRAFGEGFRFFASGGARLNPDVMKDLEALGFTVLEGYGLTETSPIVTFNPPEKRKPGSAGKPFESVEIKILKSRVSDTEGEIAIKGPMVMEGYFKNPSATAQVMENGFFLSGDLGYIDGEGYLFITGRAKEVIVLSSGKNVYPEDVEKQYMKIPLIKEICVLGVEEKGVIDTLHAVIVPDTDYAKRSMTGNISEALKWELQKLPLPPHMRLKGFTLSPGPLPRTPIGKLRRFMIKGFLKAEAKPKAEDKTLMEDEVGRAVVGCIRPLIGEYAGGIAPADNLELDLGLDSLKRIELVVSLESAFSLKLPETFASEVQTVGEIVERIKEYKVRGAKEIASAGMASLLVGEPSVEEKRKVGIRQGRIEWLITAFLMGVLKFILKVFFRLDVSGLENIPSPPFIIAPNHSSNLDGFVVGGGVSLEIFKSLYFQGFQKYFRGFIPSLFGRAAHVIPIDPETFRETALRISAYVLREKKTLCVFSEGGRSFDGKLMGFKKGIGILALELNVPVVPACIEGTFNALPRGAYRPRMGKVRLTFGKPLYPKDMDYSKKPERMDKYQFFADEVRERVKEIAKGKITL